MRRYFYWVDFSYITKNGDKSRFDLGVFSSLTKARNKIDMSADSCGFRDYPKSNFTIDKIGVDFDYEVTDKSNLTLYFVCHEYEPENEEVGVSYYSYWGYYSTIKEAEERIEYVKAHSRLGKKYPDCFEIIKVRVDNLNAWSEGFVELDCG